MTDKQIIDALLKQLNENEDGEYVTIPKEIAVGIPRMNALRLRAISRSTSL